MIDSEARTDLRGARRLATALPLVLGGVDGALLVAHVIGTGPCTDHCLAGVVLLVVAPVATPLEVASVESRAVAVLTVVAVLVVLALAGRWWVTITRAAATLSRSRRWPRGAFWGLWAAAVAATYVVAVIAAGVHALLGVLPALAAEVAVWWVVVARLPRKIPARGVSDPAA